jgi:hypothetical protein
VRQAEYFDIRNRMRPGDVIAFSGKGRISRLISRCTASPVSHVGVILRSELAAGGALLELIESTSLDGFSGVSRSRLSDRLRVYPGAVWWLPLREDIRARADLGAMYRWLLSQDRKRYDYRQVVRFAFQGLPLVGRWFVNREDYGRVFCSELVAGGFERAGILPSSCDASQITPAALCRMPLYGEVWQLAGPVRELRA